MGRITSDSIKPSIKKYRIALKQEGYWTFVVTKTDCTNQRGHSWNWIFRDNPEHNEIIKEYPKFKGIGICKCRHCGKIQSSH